MFKHMRIDRLAALLAGALLGTSLCVVSASADDAGSPQTDSPATSTSTPAPQPQAEGVAPQMSGQAASAPEGRGVPVAGTDAAAPTPVLTPMQAEIAQVLASERATVAQLQERLVAAKGTPTALELHKQVQETKVQAQLAILQIQVRYARAEGRTLVAEQLETAIREMTAPKAPGTPIDRPAPTQAPVSGAQQH